MSRRKRIREPLCRNWWRGRTVKITNGDQDVQTRTITHNDGSTLWWDTDLPWPIDDCCTFEISELSPGDVYTWSGTARQAVTGTDHAGYELLPAVDVDHGRIKAGDYMGEHVYQQLYAAINALVWTKRGASWQTCFDGSTEAGVNYKQLNFANVWSSDGFYGDSNKSFSDIVAEVRARDPALFPPYRDPVSSTCTGAAPYAQTVAEV